MPRRRLPSTKPVLGDLIAGLSVALVLIPQSLAYAELAGMPARYGLYAAGLPTIVAAIFASSRYLQTGPVAMTSLLTLGVLSPLAPTGTGHYVALAALLALVVGAMRVLMGMMKAGWVSYLMSQPVLLGFTTAAAILIILSQLPIALGVPVDGESLVVGAMIAATSIGQWDVTSMVLTIATTVLVAGSRYVHRLFPGVFLAVLIGVIYSRLTGYEGAAVGEVPSVLPLVPFALPWAEFGGLLLPGAVIALVGFADVTAISRAFAMQDREQWRPNQEFVSQGVANLAAAVVGGFPVGGSFARSSVAHMTGGKTRWTGAVSGIIVLAFLPISSVLQPLPRAVLAGIVIGAVLRLVRIRALLRLSGYPRFQVAVAWTTFASTLMLAPRVDQAILIGIALSVLIHLWRESRVGVQSDYRDGTLRLTPLGVLYFGSAPGLDLTLMHELAEHPDADAVVINLAQLGRIDYTGAVALRRIMEDATAAGLRVELANVPPQAQKTLSRVLSVGADSHA